MSVTPFPNRRAKGAPVVEVYAPSQTGTGLYQVIVWQDRNRNEGFAVNVPTYADVLTVLKIATDTLKGNKANG